MAATLKSTSRRPCWRQLVLGALTMAPLQTGTLNAKANEGTVSAAEQSILEARSRPSAEEVNPSEEDVDELDQLEGPRKWNRILRPITEVTADATLPAGLLPDQVEHEGDAPVAELLPEVGDARLMGGWGDSSYPWSATKSWHRPLYFEEVNLERYGYQCHPVLQPLVSGAHFFLTIPTLPYQATVHPPRECIYTLGHYRPGSCVPWQRHCLPWDARAAAVEAGVIVGLVFLIP